MRFLTETDPKTLLDCINSTSPCVAVIKKEVGEQDLKAMLNVLITETIEFFNVGKTMNQTQVNQTIDLIIEDFGFMKMEDFKLCFKNAKRGLYGNGQLYDRIDGQIILGWLNSHKNERMDASEAINIKKHAEFKVVERVELTEEQKAGIKLLKDSFTKWAKEWEDRPKEKTPSAVVDIIPLDEFKKRFEKNKHIFSVEELKKMFNEDFKGKTEIQKIILQEMDLRK